VRRLDGRLKGGHDEMKVMVSLLGKELAEGKGVEPSSLPMAWLSGPVSVPHGATFRLTEGLLAKLLLCSLWVTL